MFVKPAEDVTFSPPHLSAARPPDTFIQKTKQRYNTPRSLSTKINLADMQTEIKLRPPYQLSPEDLRAINGFSVPAASKYKGLGLEPAAGSTLLRFAEAVTFPLLSCSSHPGAGAGHPPRYRLLRAEHALRRPEPAARSPRHRERAAGTGPCSLPFLDGCVFLDVIDALFLTRLVLKERLPPPPQQNDDEDFNYVIAFFLGTAACLYQVSDCPPVRAAHPRLTNSPCTLQLSSLSARLTLASAQCLSPRRCLQSVFISSFCSPPYAKWSSIG